MNPQLIASPDRDIVWLHVFLGRLSSEQKRGLRGTERERSKLLEHTGVNNKILLAFQANAPGDAAQVYDSEPGHLQELEDGQRADADGRMRPAR